MTIYPLQSRPIISVESGKEPSQGIKYHYHFDFGPYFVRLSYDLNRGFQAKVGEGDRWHRNVSIDAIFTKSALSIQQVILLGDQFHPSQYDIRLVELDKADGLFKLRIQNNLKGGCWPSWCCYGRRKRVEKDSPSVETLKTNWLASCAQEGQKLTPTYVFPRASRSIDGGSPFPLRDDLNLFIRTHDPRKTYTVFAPNGFGVNEACKRMCHELWTTRKKGDLVPLVIDCLTIQDQNDAIEPALRDRGLKADEIEQIKKENRFLFFFLNADRRGKEMFNLYKLLRINSPGQYQGKVVYTFLTPFFSTLGEKRSMHFAPARGSYHYNEEEHSEAFILPFSATELRAYFSMKKREGAAIQASIDSIQTLSQLATIPGFLPVIESVITYSSREFQVSPPKDIEKNLFPELVKKWIHIQKSKLGITDVQFEEKVMHYYKKFAEHQKTATGTVKNEPSEDLFGDSSSETDELFKAENLPYLFVGLVRMVGEKEYAFLTSSLFDFFFAEAGEKKEDR